MIVRTEGGIDETVSGATHLFARETVHWNGTMTVAEEDIDPAKIELRPGPLQTRESTLWSVTMMFTERGGGETVRIDMEGIVRHGHTQSRIAQSPRIMITHSIYLDARSLIHPQFLVIQTAPIRVRTPKMSPETAYLERNCYVHNFDVKAKRRPPEKLSHLQVNGHLGPAVPQPLRTLSAVLLPPLHDVQHPRM